jgi:PAS domain S-box-containing protein
MTETSNHRSQLETVCNNATAALFIMDEHNHCTYMNPAAVELTGYTLDEVKGHLLHDLIHHSYPDGSQYPIDECPIVCSLQAGPQTRGEEVFVHKDGHFYDVTFAASIISEGEQVVGAVLEVQDITDRKRAEEALREANARLLESDRRKDEFLAMLAHELRNPLAPIHNTLTLLERSFGGDPQVQRYLQILRRQAGSLSGLVDDLLDVSRITRGLVELKEERVDLTAVIDRALESTQVALDERNHEVSVTVPRKTLFVMGDWLRLEQILVNLLTNAAKYTDPGGRIAISLERSDNRALLKVQDNGIGLEPDILERIFDIFSQAERGLDRTEGGLGIGLTIVERLVKLHGGRIEAKSEGAGRGAEFHVTLPLAKEEEGRDSAPTMNPRSSDAGTVKRILVVDDNADAAETMALLLETCGHDTAVVHDGLSALAKAAEMEPDVVLLDIGLPGMDGYEVARRLRQNPTTRHAVLAALTGYGQVRDVERARDSGFDKHFTKPVDIEVLQAFLCGEPTSL